MNLLTPMALWFAATLPVVVALYLLKRRRVSRLVSSTVLWQRFLAESQANSPFQKLRNNWLMLLQLLLLLLAVLALSRPYFSGNPSEGRWRVVILDASASMQSVDVEPSRFEQAKREILAMIQSMTGRDRMVILQSGARTEVRQSPTSDKAALRRALDDCTPSDAPTRLTDAFLLARNLIENQEFPEVHLFSDGVISELEELEKLSLPLTYHKIGVRGDNLGVVHMDVKAHPENPEQRAVFSTIANFSDRSRTVGVELLFDEVQIENQFVTLDAGESLPMVFPVGQERDGVFSVRVSQEDDLPVDNRADWVSRLPKTLKVLLVTQGNRLLEKALLSVPNLELAVQGTYTGSEADVDVVVLDGVIPTEWPRENTLALKVSAPDWFGSVETLELPTLVDWRATHPVLRFVDLDNVVIARSGVASTPGWGQSLMESPNASLAVAGEIERQRIIWLGFDVLESSWPLRISFPIFMANAMNWLNPDSEDHAPVSVRCGSPYRIYFESDSEASAEVVFPDGHTRTLVRDPQRDEVLFSDTDQVGIYQVRVGEHERAFTVTLLDDKESQNLPKEALSAGEYLLVQSTSVRQANLEVWRWFVLVGIGVMFYEWWFYHRRTV